MSSVAYATEASMFTLLAVGTVAFGYLMPISVLIVGLLFLVTFSYRQTIRAYPNGGGSYIVAHANLGTIRRAHRRGGAPDRLRADRRRQRVVGRVQLRVGVPGPPGLTVPLIVGSILLVMVVNLRGIRESGTVFALPTYVFIASVLLLVGVGLVRTALGEPPQVTGVVADRGPRRERSACCS